MEVTGATYLYTVAVIGITFIGFSAIVMMLRQTSGEPSQPLDILVAHIYMEFGLIISVGSLLPSLLAFWRLSPQLVWQISSALVGLPLLVISVIYPARRRRAASETLPWYTKQNIATIILISVVFLTNASGIIQDRAPAVFLTAMTAFMAFALASWLRALNIIFLKDLR